jgi:Uma2 family endonuclease
MCEPAERGAEAPDWFYVANVPPTINGQIRRSYVLWQEFIPPLIVLEFRSPLSPPLKSRAVSKSQVNC